MKFEDKTGLIWYDGNFVDWKSADIHVMTHGLHYASSVFEGERAYDGKIFKLEEHTERLFTSAEILNMTIPFTPNEINKVTIELLEKNQLHDCYIRPVVWRGANQMGLSSGDNPIHVAIAAWEWPSYFTYEKKMKGLRLTEAAYKRPSPDTAPVHSKAAGLYMICTLSKARAEEKGFDDCLFLDYRGYVAEATGANIFMLMDDGKLHTPIADCFLNGITRQCVIALAQELDIEVIERHIHPDELKRAQEIFITGTAIEITPVSEIDGMQYQPGDMCKKMISAYDALVGKK